MTIRNEYERIRAFISESIARYLLSFEESADNPSEVDSAVYVVAPIDRVLSKDRTFILQHLAAVTIRLQAGIPYTALPFDRLYGLWGSVATLWLEGAGQSLDDLSVPILVNRGSDVSDDWLIVLQWRLVSVVVPSIDPSTTTPDVVPIILGGDRISCGLWRSPLDTVASNLNDDFLDQELTGVP
jgi:hypothetical protein